MPRQRPAPACRLRHAAPVAAGLFASLCAAQPGALSTGPAAVDWQPVGDFSIARTETTVAQFRCFADATKTVTRAERDGGGQVDEAGWVHKPGWTWRTPFGGDQRAADNEPAVHLDFDEAQAFCRWAGGSLPTDAQWVTAAYTEQRARPASGFVAGRTYRYPTGDAPTGAQCLDDCGAAPPQRAVAHGARLSRGHGHALVTATPAGVNGLHDMGGNVWEWVDEPVGASGNAARRTRGGSCSYGEAQMQAGHLQDKPADTVAVSIGFRCARSA